MTNGSGNRMRTNWNPFNLPTLVKVLDNANKLRVDKVSSALTYYGQSTYGAATSEPKWFISRISKAGTLTSVDLASDQFNQIWDNRTSLTYN